MYYLEDGGTMFVIDASNPFRTLEIRCDVAVVPDPDHGVAHARATLRHTPVLCCEEAPPGAVSQHKTGCYSGLMYFAR